MKRSIYFFLALLLVVAFTLSACGAASDTAMTASGTLSALEVPIAPELGGRVVEINVKEGDTVRAGDALFRLDDELLQAQYEQVKGAVDAAAATLQAAQAQLVYVQSQYDLAVQGARAQDMQARQSAWGASVPQDYRPIWYFQTNELLTAAQVEVDAAAKSLKAKQSDLDNELKKASNQDFIAAEARLAQAQFALLVAQQTHTQAGLAKSETLTDASQDNLDAAQSELDAARLDYNRMLTTSAADAVLTARARVAVEQARSDNARDALLRLQTGDESLQVRTAQAAVDQAAAAVTQAEANLSQAKAALALVGLQVKRTVIKSPMDGIVLSRNLEIGEIAAPGGVVMSIGQLQDMKLVVYIPETQYGQVDVGQSVNITVDSFPSQVFPGQVIRIADEAEFTPRNVQTVAGRKSTVYAVEITVPNPDNKLKSGMPADVTFVAGSH